MAQRKLGATAESMASERTNATGFEVGTMTSPRLINSSKGLELAADLKTARGFYQRGKGLLGRKSLPTGEGLWIHQCTSIHTCFMKFAIDAVFVDENLVVRAIYHNIPPWRMTLPAWGASSVFELPAGTLARCPTVVGDQLYVGA